MFIMMESNHIDDIMDFYKNIAYDTPTKYYYITSLCPGLRLFGIILKYKSTEFPVKTWTRSYIPQWRVPSSTHLCDTILPLEL